MNFDNISTKIFLDSANPQETIACIKKLGKLDGQTTNPSLAIKNPEIHELLNGREKISSSEMLNFYKETVVKISNYIPDGSVSVEVYADRNTSSRQMVAQAKAMNTWIPNAHIKLPISKEGIEAATEVLSLGIRVNMTLCFSQEQAAAIYLATKGANRGSVFISPFVGRLDDIGENGMDLIKNILEMYKKGDGHVYVLTASVRNKDHFKYSIKLGSDIITAPAKINCDIAQEDLDSIDNFEYNSGNLAEIPLKEISLGGDWKNINIQHDLTDKGIDKFAADWNSVIAQ